METINLIKYTRTIRFVGRVGKEIVFNKNKDLSAKVIKDDIVTMGPVYIKIGQIISTRTDIFPDYLTNVFKDLQNDVIAMPFDKVEKIFKSNFNDNIETYFIDFDQVPLASASIGQVHIGTLRNNNTKVAVKFLKENIKDSFKTELLVIIQLMQLSSYLYKNKNITDSLSILKELYETIDLETDFTKELESMMIFKRILDKNDNILVPRVYKRLSSSEVLTMEYLPSVKITDIHKTKFKNSNQFLATELMKSFISMILSDGYIHCDPHPGNIGINSEGKLVLYDYGMVKKFDGNIKEYFRKIFMALVNRSSIELIDFMLSSDILIALESKGKTSDQLSGYEMILLERLIEYIYEYLNTLDINGLISSIENDPYININDIPFEFDNQLVYLFKSFSTLEGVCKQMYNEFNYIDLISELVIDFLDFEMILDKVKFDIQYSTNSTPIAKNTNNYIKLSIENLNKEVVHQNKKVIIAILLSVLLHMV
jgi:predicted unusual protein kinase regulating ubiquinone biosynthesis (AarF/ABC1/UbiB family)